MGQHDILRRVRLTPYRPGMGPRFALTIWDTGRRDYRGSTTIGYRLTMDRAVLFQGEDFNGSPLHAIDSDDTIAALMGFLTLRPGDTDPEYFAAYTPIQVAYCEQHAEALGCEVMDRFGEV